MIPSFSNQSITRIRPEQKEVRGTTVPDWNNVTELIISPVLVQPSQSSISLDGRVLGVTDSYTVFCNLDADVIGGDKIIFENNVYFVDEEPRNWNSPTGIVSNKQFTMVRHKG